MIARVLPSDGDPTRAASIDESLPLISPPEQGMRSGPDLSSSIDVRADASTVPASTRQPSLSGASTGHPLAPEITDPRVAAAYRLFDANDTDRARSVLERVARAGPLEEAGRELLDLLLPSPASLTTIDAILSRNEDALTLVERSRWLARRFDGSLPGSANARDAALDLLGAATMAGDAGWAIVQQTDRRRRIDLALREPDAQIDLLEQEALAPAATGLPSTVPGRTVAFGRRMAAQGDLDCVREAERLLHVLGEPQLAYLVERERKQWASRGTVTPARPARVPAHRASRLTVVLAGGHPPLRRLARRELDELDLADVRDFPSAWEGNRQGRHARDTIEGSDLAVLIWRQIAHSTSDQVRTAARALSVPVVRADTPTISAIRRAVSAFEQGGEG